MPLFKTQGAAVFGIDANLVQVEIDLTPRPAKTDGQPDITMIGLSDAAARASRERIRAAVNNLGFSFPPQHVTVNLSPANIGKEVSGLDLPIAVGILGAVGIVKDFRVADSLLVGELSLDGRVRPDKGALSMALKAREAGIRNLFVPFENSRETVVVAGLNTYGVETLAQVVDLLNASELPAPVAVDASAMLSNGHAEGLDFREVRGHFQVRRALEVAVAGGHNILMIGPPGSGKTMLAKRIAGILPAPTFEEALDVTRIHGVAGLTGASGLVASRPFRSPHHTIGDAGLFGDGSSGLPGETALAHNGVLFLDEVPEFGRRTLEALRGPLDGGNMSGFPRRFMLAAAMNPCPCGFYNDTTRGCACSDEDIRGYLSRISGSFLDRIDIRVDVPAVKSHELAKERDGESSADIRERVTAARERQSERFRADKDDGDAVFCNAQMPPSLLRKYCRVTEESRKLLGNALTRMGLSARAHDRILKVGRTIADLDRASEIGLHHVAEAIQYRGLDRTYWDR